ncbi:Crp/Fnr family transcriptional regulator [Paracoccus xiamenensis]|uniref:Crp/Fnr family transcriptional regulator n=1 Tax=Paracoccus xiamenensis TaxID=2714901 RepID=UPI0014073F62|nr:cyclic nucleotide-binding domain-containing protein [Paracoccus xiamenensis]NHF73195.1 cyclic nucleotide-binding domain-containing protein [Paracoccus xiamenensis]
MTPKIISAAKASVMLRYLPDAVLERLLEGATPRQFDAGETIFLQGEPANSVYLIVDGWVKLYRISRSGAEAVVSILKSGQSFAEAVALRDEHYPVSSEAITGSTLVQIDGNRIRRQIAEDPQLALSLLAASYVHLHGLVEQVEQLKARSGVQRLAEFLVDLAGGHDNGARVALPYNKTLIAGHLGIQPESLSRAFARLRDHGVRIDGNHAIIEDLDKLRELSSQDKGQPWTR